jgi:large subunit ribosomal protein L10
MPNNKNVANLEVIREKIAEAKSVLVVDYAGTGVNDQSELRRKLKEAGGEFFVTKNTLISLGFDKKKEVTDALTGMNGLILSYDDEVGAVKVVYDFIKDKEKMTVKLGYMEGKILTPEEAEALSRIPGKKELIAQLIGSLEAPVKGMMNVLQGNLRGLVYALQAIVDKK